MLNKAIEIATNIHEGQVDKAGRPYIGHSLRVMGMGVTDDEKIVWVLHDVVRNFSTQTKGDSISGEEIGIGGKI